MVSDAKKEAIARYDATHTKQIKLKLNLETDADILEMLRSKGNIQGYIKTLIRDDILKNGGTKNDNDQTND